MMRWRRIRRLFGLEPVSDVENELSFHIEMCVADLVARGESPERARELAMARFGDYQSAARECVAIGDRRQRRLLRREYVDELRQDARYALRTLSRAPGFTIVAILTLALGIGANSAIFSVVHGVVLEALPFRDADRLFRIRMVQPDGTPSPTLSAPNFATVRDQGRVLERIEAYTSGTMTLTGSGEPREIRSVSVSGGLLELLAVPVTRGRGFLPEENAPGRTMVAVLDHRFWQRDLGGDPAAVGRSLVLNGESFTIVGVLAPGARLPADAPGARLPTDADVYLPLRYDQTFNAAAPVRRNANFLGVIGRARYGAGPREIDDDLQRIAADLRQRFGGTTSFGAIPVRELMLGEVRTPLLVLLGAVGFVLLIACANVANLFLARASARRGELALRAALGAGRGRLVRQLLTEASVLAAAGGAVGLAIAFWGGRALVAARPDGIPRLDGIGLGGEVVLFTGAITLLTVVVFGILPARQATAGGPLAVHGIGRGGDGGGSRTRAVLVVAQIALAVVLLTGAGLLVRSFIAMTRVDPGFPTDRAMSFRVALQGTPPDGVEQIRLRAAQLEQRLRALPGVSQAGATTLLPFAGLSPILSFSVVGAPPPPSDVNPEISVASVTPRYFDAIGTPIRRGRGFTEADDERTALVAVINGAAARRWFADRDPIGQRVTMGGVRVVVGVVADVLQRSPRQPPAPQLFVPFAQRTSGVIRVVVRSSLPPSALVQPILAEIRAVGRHLPVSEFAPLEDLASRSVARPRFYTAVLALFAAVALALAAVGIFGVTSYGVSQRSREISVRLALGARTGQVLALVLGRALALALAGVTAGLGIAFALGRVIQSQLFGVSVFDPLTSVSVAAVLIACAVVAGYFPARRAARLDPGSVLR